MLSVVPFGVLPSASARERYHGAIVYRRLTGNRDVDVDALSGSVASEAALRVSCLQANEVEATIGRARH